ncbi:hypothetical protein ACP70R_021964 [Stipagrostis hirtigluma subsp. patula]
MAGSGADPEQMTDSQKLDRLMAQMTTMNTRMDNFGLRLTRTEKTIAGDDNRPRLHALPCVTMEAAAAAAAALINFPHYDGEADPLTWINKCESYFRGMRTMPEEKVWLAALHLEGAAAEWYYALERDFGIVSWARFVEYINLRFSPPIRANALAELKDLRRTGSVEEYQRQFLTLLCRCDDLTPQQQINLFTAGLGKPLRTDVELQYPANLQMAVSTGTPSCECHPGAC